MWYDDLKNAISSGNLDNFENVVLIPLKDLKISEKGELSLEDKEKLVLLLYVGILRFIAKARVAIAKRNTQEKVLFINKASAVFMELSNSIDFSSTDVAYYLNGLYAKAIARLMEANAKNDPALLDEVVNVTQELIAAWNEETNTQAK